MIGSMRLSRLRATFVLLLAVLYIGSGVVSALMLCCPHPPTSAEAMMDCDMPGMAHHHAPAGPRLKAGCPVGHDQGVPANGFTALPSVAKARASPELITLPLTRVSETAIARVVFPLTPPPKFSL